MTVGTLTLRAALATLLFGLACQASAATLVRMETSAGNIDIQLMDEQAPLTVANFLSYVNSGAYDASFIHRSVPGFVIQGGGYRWNTASSSVALVPTLAPISNEASAARSNVRGTIAMALVGSDINSGTSQWFFNLSDANSFLDASSFTVFGTVVSGMDVVDAIAAMRIVNANSGAATAFGELPVMMMATPLTNQNLVMVNRVSVAPVATGTVTEFYNSNLDHYFITADANEAAAIDNGSAGPGWSRTGYSFKSGGTVSVCRFYGSMSPGPNSHFYTADAGECQGLKDAQIPAGDARRQTEKSWNYESLDFQTGVPANQVCPVGTVPVYRAYNNGWTRGVDSNHRISSSQAAIQEVVARGWSDEGLVMCAPQ